MKKVFVMFLAAVLSLSLIACSGNAANDNSSDNGSTEQKQESNTNKQQEDSKEEESSETNSSEENVENANPFADYAYREENGGIIITEYLGTDTNVIIPEGVVKIESVPFINYTELKEVTIPNSVTEIEADGGVSPFMGCVNLESVNIGSGLTEIEGWFSGMPSLKTVTISDGVTSIGAAAFWGCTNLETLTIPESVTKIAGSNGIPPFTGCDNLTLSVKAGSYAEQYAIDNNIPYTTYE